MIRGMNDIPQHPGAYVRNNVIPKTMNVTTAPKKLEVRSVALSNFLNGKSDLSQEMAARLDLAFGEPARKLLDMQSAWDSSQPKRSEEKTSELQSLMRT